MQGSRRHQVFVNYVVKKVVYTNRFPARLSEQIAKFDDYFGIVAWVWNLNFASQEPTEPVTIQKEESQTGQHSHGEKTQK